MNKSLSHVTLFFKGFCIGVANIIPGVSGGTMAFILGIYEDLLDAIRSFDRKFFTDLLALKLAAVCHRPAWIFLGLVILGVLSATFSLSRLLDWLLNEHAVSVYGFFFGLIISSVILVSRAVKKWNSLVIIGLVLSSIISFFLVGLVPVQTPQASWFVFLAGALAICAMILPGISGAFILLLIGKYQYILSAINDRDVTILSVFGAGAGIGLFLFSHFLGWLLRRWHDLVMIILTGLMIGSLRKIWPWKQTLQFIIDARGEIIPLVQRNIIPNLNDPQTLGTVLLAFFGFLSAFGLELLSQNEKGKDLR